MGKPLALVMRPCKRHGALKLLQMRSEAGATMQHVVRTRMFMTDAKLWEEVGRAHGKVFGDVRLASTMIEVSALLDPEWLVEIEADAVIGDDPRDWQNAWAPSESKGDGDT